MAVALDLASNSIVSNSTAITVFAPADFAFSFSNSGQPTLSLSLIRYHILPVAFPLRSLKSLPFGAKIATLLDGRSLTVTTLPADRLVSLNNVKVTESPIFDDGSLIIFGTKRFFDPYFRISGPIGSYGSKNFGCLATPNANKSMAFETAAYYPFSEACKVLESEGCSVMASFLETQFLGFLHYQTMWTVFAPVDQVVAKRIGNVSQWSSILRRHVVPCRFSWSDLKSLEDGTVLKTTLRGFMINVQNTEKLIEEKRREALNYSPTVSAALNCIVDEASRTHIYLLPHPSLGISTVNSL